MEEGPLQDPDDVEQIRDPGTGGQCSGRRPLGWRSARTANAPDGRKAQDSSRRKTSIMGEGLGGSKRACRSCSASKKGVAHHADPSTSSSSLDSALGLCPSASGRCTGRAARMAADRRHSTHAITSAVDSRMMITRSMERGAVKAMRTRTPREAADEHAALLLADAEGHVLPRERFAARIAHLASNPTRLARRGPWRLGTAAQVPEPHGRHARRGRG